MIRLCFIHVRYSPLYLDGYSYELCELKNPTYLRPERPNQLLRVPDGIPLGATGKEDTLFVSFKVTVRAQNDLLFPLVSGWSLVKGWGSQCFHHSLVMLFLS